MEQSIQRNLRCLLVFLTKKFRLMDIILRITVICISQLIFCWYGFDKYLNVRCHRKMSSKSPVKVYQDFSDVFKAADLKGESYQELYNAEWRELTVK